MEQEKEIGRVEADITILQHDNIDFEQRLRSIEMKISEKRTEISRLEAQMREYETRRQVKLYVKFEIYNLGMFLSKAKH